MVFILIFFLKPIYFIWLCWVLIAACKIFSCRIHTLICSILFPDQGSQSPALGTQSLSH